jgi:oxaloacetate decarboxylase alpha subunit
MTTAMMGPIAPLLDRAGFEAIDLVGGAVFDVAVRYLREDPWERMRILSSWVTETPLVVHHRGQSLFTFDFFPDDVVERTAERIAANGIRYHTTYDALNDMRNLEVPVRAAKNVGLYTVGGLVYTHSPVHTDAYYAGKAHELRALGVDGVFIKDPSGLLTPERMATLVPVLKAVCGELPLQLHMHCLTGLAPYAALQAVEHGVDVVHTATAPIANGASHPPTELFTRNCRRRGHEVSIDLEPVEEAADKLAFIAERESKALGQPLEYDEFHFHHQVPGGMVSNLRYQLETLNISERLEEILEEAGHVRADLGYPIVVSPFAQYVITQAVLNVMGKDQNRERYATVPDEVRRYVMGGYGEIAGAIDPNLYDRITRGTEPVTERPGALVPPALERTREERGSFQSDDDLLLAVFYDEAEYGALKAAGPINTEYSLAAKPLVTLVKEIAARPGIKSIHLTNRDATLRESRP